MPMTETRCIDCGAPTSGGLRDKKCHGAMMARMALQETAERDHQLLTMLRTEGLNGQRLAARLGISKTRARERIRTAEEREAKRAAQDQVDSGAFV